MHKLGAIILSGSFLILPNISFPQSAELFLKTRHPERVNSVAFSPDGKYFATGSADNTVKIWDGERGELLRTLSGHEADIFAVAISPDGRTLASASYDAKIKIWDVARGALLQTLLGHSRAVTAVAFSPDGKRLASASRDSTVKIWDAERWHPIHTLRGHGDRVYSTVFSPDGQFLASAGEDAVIRIWNTKTGIALGTLAGHSKAVNSIAFSPDGRLLASASDDSTVKIWFSGTWTLLHTLIGYEGEINVGVFSLDGKALASASADGTVKIWDTETWQLSQTFDDSQFAVLSLAFHPDGKKLLSARADNSVTCWDLERGQSIFELSGQPLNVLDVAFSPDGQTLASSHENGGVNLWDTRHWVLRQTLDVPSQKAQAIDFSPAGGLLACASLDQMIRIWDIKSANVLRTLEGHTGAVYAVVFSADGSRLASAGADKSIKVWDASSGESLFTLRGHGASIWSLDFSHDGILLASASDDYTIKIWDILNVQMIGNLKSHTSLVRSIQFDASSQRLASGSSDNSIKIWNVNSGEIERTLLGHASSVRTALFSPDGRLLASGSFDNTIKIWNPQNGELLRTLPGHSNDINALAFSPDGRLLVSASLDGTIRIWDPHSGEVKFLLASFPKNEWLVYHPAKIVFNASPNGAQHAALRFDNNLYNPHPLQDFEAELRREHLDTALLEPSPAIKPKTASRPGILMRNNIIWISGLLVAVFLIVLAKRIVDQRTDFLRIVEQFFKAAGFVKADKISPDLLWLHSRNGQVSGLAYLYQKGHHPSPKMTAIYERFQTKLHKAKLYLIHDEPLLAKAAIQGIRDELHCETVPLPAAAIRKAVAEKKCRQKLHELEEAFLIQADPYFFDQPIKHPFWFYGREEVLHRLPALLAQGQHVWLWGLPKIGKTSLAHQLRLRLSELPAVFLDFQIQQNWEDQARETLRQLGDELRAFGIKQLSTVKTNVRQSLLDYSEGWQRTGRKEPILLVIDGCNFPGQRKNNSHQEANPFLQTLLEVAQSSHSFVLLVIGVRSDPGVPSIMENDLMMRHFHEEYLECLTPLESQTLIHEIGQWRRISWNEPAAERVFYFCGGHPFVTRWFASQACQGGSLKRIDLGRVDETAQEIQASLQKNDFGRFYHDCILTPLIENEWQLLDLVSQQSEQGLLENKLPPRFKESAAYLENLGLLANDVGRLSLTSHLFKSYLQLFRVGRGL